MPLFGQNMKHPWTKARELIGAILAAGIRVIVIAAAIEFVLGIIACGIGIAVWINYDFLTGLLAGLVAFFVGQSLVELVLDMILQFPERSSGHEPVMDDDEVLDALRSELGTTAERAVAPNHSLPPALKPTHSVRGSEDS